MSIHDRVKIGDGYKWEQETGDDGRPVCVMAYSPIADQNGQPKLTPDGCAIIENAGGVAVGSEGTIVGPQIDVHKSYLHNAQDYAASLGGSDKVQLVPVMLDVYQRVGWFPSISKSWMVSYRQHPYI
jgi:hypothetical protein